MKRKCRECKNYNSVKKMYKDPNKCVKCMIDEAKEKARKSHEYHVAKCRKYHLCMKCGVKLEDDDTHVKCPKCREEERNYVNLRNAMKRERKRLEQ